MKTRAVLGIMLTLLLISMLTLAFNIQTANAELGTWILDDDPAGSVAIVAIDPLLSKAAVGETFTVNLTVGNIFIDIGCNGLYGWEIQLVFDPAVLEVVNASEGPFLKDTGYETTWPSPRINNTVGFIAAGALFFPPFPPSGAAGNGTLASVTFLVKAERACLLYIDYTFTELYTVVYLLDEYSVVLIDYTTVDGYFYSIILAHNVDTGLDYRGLQCAIDAP